MAAGLRVLAGGSGSPVLLLLHGLGATGDVWDGWRPLLARRWPGRWLAPDLPGHGGSPPLAAYSFDSFATAVAGIVPPGGPVVVLGHSLGGVVGLALAGRGSGVRAVTGLGIKVAWTGEELSRAQAAARRPTAWFATRDEAAARYLRISGLDGLRAAGDPVVVAGLVERDGRWRLALDQAAFDLGAPDMAALLARSRAPVVLARGEHDPMNSDEQLAKLGTPVVTLPGLGHNAHVEDPEAAAALLDPYLLTDLPRPSVQNESAGRDTDDALEAAGEVRLVVEARLRRGERDRQPGKQQGSGMPDSEVRPIASARRCHPSFVCTYGDKSILINSPRIPPMGLANTLPGFGEYHPGVYPE